MDLRLWRGAAALLAVLCLLGFGARARADETVDVGPTPILNVQLGTGMVTIQTWDQPQMQVENSGSVTVEHFDAGVVDPRLHKQIAIPWKSIDGPDGRVDLPAEQFVMPPLGGTTHDAVSIHGDGNTTITVPNGTALVFARVGNGGVNLNNYRGVFVAHVRTGQISFDHVEGSGFAEVLRGPVIASDSTFDRLRVRTALGNMLFDRCTSNQIEATSRYGSIVYDNGRFNEGLAHFESEHGNVALGVNGGARMNGRSDTGHVVSSFHDEAKVHSDVNSAQATVRGGGPVVTAHSRNGSVYLYNGSLDTHPGMQAELRGRAMLNNPYDALPGSYRPANPYRLLPSNPNRGAPNPYRGAPNPYRAGPNPYRAAPNPYRAPPPYRAAPPGPREPQRGAPRGGAPPDRQGGGRHNPPW